MITQIGCLFGNILEACSVRTTLRCISGATIGSFRVCPLGRKPPLRNVKSDVNPETSKVCEGGYQHIRSLRPSGSVWDEDALFRITCVIFLASHASPRRGSGEAKHVSTVSMIRAKPLSEAE